MSLTSWQESKIEKLTNLFFDVAKFFCQVDPASFVKEKDAAANMYGSTEAIRATAEELLTELNADWGSKVSRNPNVGRQYRIARRSDAANFAPDDPLSGLLRKSGKRQRYFTTKR